MANKSAFSQGHVATAIARLPSCSADEVRALMARALDNGLIELAGACGDELQRRPEQRTSARVGPQGPTQRDAMRQLLLRFGHDRARVCAAYADAERAGEITRKSDLNGMTPEQYAAEVWADGHKPSNAWIVAFCDRHRIPTGG